MPEALAARRAGIPGENFDSSAAFTHAGCSDEPDDCISPPGLRQQEKDKAAAASLPAAARGKMNTTAAFRRMRLLPGAQAARLRSRPEGPASRREVASA